ncbi:hypothetical protein BDD12DRAFT_907614 [Trichophaea hybrida]|nr:hypothetical protein BDD12DRAFT_907614 [Trichophaea hybrida]
MQPPPMLPKISAPAFIGLIVFGFILALFLVVARYKILRNAPRDFYKDFAKIAFTFYSILITIDGALILFQAVCELQLERKYPGSKDHEKVLHGMSTAFIEISNFYMSITYSLELWILKASFLTYFFPMRRRCGLWLRRYLYLTAITLVVTLVSLVSLGFLYCTPIQRNWSAGGDHCLFLESRDGIIIQTSMNLATDVMIIILAICFFQRINGRSERWGSLVIIAIGILSPIMATLRFMVVIRLAWFPEKAEATELARANASYGALENYTAMIAFFLPSLRVWYRHRDNKPLLPMRAWYWFVGQPEEPWDRIIWKIELDQDRFPVRQVPAESVISKMKRGFGLRGPRVVVLDDVEMIGDTVLSGHIDYRNRRPIPIGRNDSINPISWYDEEGNLVWIELED